MSQQAERDEEKEKMWKDLSEGRGMTKKSTITEVKSQYAEIICYSIFYPEEGNIRPSEQTETLYNHKLDMFIVYLSKSEKSITSF